MAENTAISGGTDFAVFAYADKDEAKRKEYEQEGETIEVKARSRQLMDSFRPIWFFMIALGRFPHERLLTRDGTILLRFSWASPSALAFVVSSVASIILFAWVTVGLAAAVFNPGDTNKKDICGETWEQGRLREAFCPILIVWGSLLTLFISSLIGLLRAKDIEKYFNYWNRAVQAMDMNLNYRVGFIATRDTVIFFVIALIYIVLYAVRFSEAVDSTASMIANSIIRFSTTDYFISPELGSRAMSETDYQKLRKLYLQGKPMPERLPFAKPQQVVVNDLLGLAIIILGQYGARCFTILFLFFTQLMRNATWIWNERFNNYLHGEQPDPTDQTKRRMDQSFLIKDHLILVQIFKLTESNFTIVLQTFYCIQVVYVTMIMYSFSLITTASSCHEYWDLAFSYNCYEIRGIFESRIPNAVSFESPNRDIRLARAQHILLHVILMAQSFLALFQTTLSGASAYEEAMRGWQILRRHSFMTAGTNRDRNFVHSLVISYARNNPMQISAGGYFDVNKELLVTISVTALIYFSIMLQFRPLELSVSGITCNGSSSFDIYSETGII